MTFNFIFPFQFPGNKSISHSGLITKFYLPFEDSYRAQQKLAVGTAPRGTFQRRQELGVLRREGPGWGVGGGRGAVFALRDKIVW